MNGVQTRFKCKLDVKRCKRFVFPPSSLLPRSNALKTKAIRYFQTDQTLTRIVSSPLEDKISDEENYGLINQVKEFILKNIDKENLTIDEIASELYMSRTAFFTKWKALTGEAPKYLIYRIRMEKARELLESGKYSVNVLPEMIGLKSLKNFRHKYKEYFGITPSESIMKKQ